MYTIINVCVYIKSNQYQMRVLAEEELILFVLTIGLNLKNYRLVIVPDFVNT